MTPWGNMEFGILDPDGNLVNSWGGPGEGYTVNLPVPGGSGDAVYGSLAESVEDFVGDDRGITEIKIVARRTGGEARSGR